MNHKQYVKSIMTRDSEGQHKIMCSRALEQVRIYKGKASGILLLFNSLTRMMIIRPLPFKVSEIGQLDAF